ncbi:MAG TPA: sulfotransferase [Rhodanobacteraceae bacterium]|nr:sulfotransferase [Rhodanobacteraceae bacterium]
MTDDSLTAPIVAAPGLAISSKPSTCAASTCRLGRRYLELTADLRKERPFSTDKLPNNWRALGAIRAMLPGARIVWRSAACHSTKPACVSTNPDAASRP